MCPCSQSYILILYIQYFVKLIMSLYVLIKQEIKKETENDGLKVIVLNSLGIFGLCYSKINRYLRCIIKTANRCKGKSDLLLLYV